EVAFRINRSPGWVQTRYQLLTMPQEIQEAADKGWITPSDVRELQKYSGAEQLKIAGKICDARKRGEGRGIAQRLKKRDKPNTRKIRSRVDIQEMMEHIRSTLKECDREQTI